MTNYGKLNQEKFNKLPLEDQEVLRYLQQQKGWTDEQLFSFSLRTYPTNGH